ncbi:MAG: leucine-rich repeat domain-containing protein [Bacteroides sp.]|nr:leucine-rich repeat domain-containing protein [Bacteroides sp.]
MRIDGVIIDKSQTTIVRCAKNQIGDYMIPDNILFIEQEAFKDCINISSVWLPNSILTIGFGAFKGCCSLVSINIPSKIIYLYKDVLNGCVNLKEIYVYCTIPPKCILGSYSKSTYGDEWMLIDKPLFPQQLNQKLTCFEGINKKTTFVYVPLGSVELYRNAVGWCEFDNIVGVHSR